MRESRKLIYAVAAAALLMVGTLGVRAAPTCVRFVKVYRERAVHHVSKETLARWALWGKDHPNFRPKRKPPLGPEESLKKVVVACEIPVYSQTFAGLLPPIDETSLLTTEDVPVYVAVEPPPFTLVGTPLEAAPIAPTDDLPTPEPSTFILLGSAMALLIVWKRDRLFRSFQGNGAVNSAA